jgi:mono/diheme cytochrome c family protein
MKETTKEKATTAFILASLLAVGMVAGSAWAAPQQAPEQGFAWKDGAEVYNKVCALCHDTAVGPSILGRGHDPIYIQLMVRNGSRAMPAFRASEIDDESLKKLAEYVSKTAADK